MGGKTSVGKKGRFAGQGVDPVVFVPSPSPRIEAVLGNRTACFQVGNGAQMVAEDVVNRPASCSNLFGYGYCGVGIATNPDILGGCTACQLMFTTAAKNKEWIIIFNLSKNAKSNLSNSLNEATFAGSFVYLALQMLNQYTHLTHKEISAKRMQIYRNELQVFQPDKIANPY